MTKGITLLYVEDDDIVRENYNEIFKTYFENVITTGNGNEALKLYKNHPIDVAILDISIHGMNGLNLATKIREISSETIILMITAYSDNDKLLKAINLDLFGYLVKPIIHQELDETLKRIIAKVPKDTILELPNKFSWQKNSKTLSYNNETIKLTKNESKIIEILLSNKNKYLTACEIQDELFEQTNINDTTCNNIVQLISRLKKKILHLYKQEEYFIENCYGAGYKIIVT